MKRRIFKILLLLTFAALSGLVFSACSSTRNLCPAYDNKYAVEPLPY